MRVGRFENLGDNRKFMFPFFLFVFSSPSTQKTHTFDNLIANVGYRPDVDFGNRGLEGRLSTLESVVYACPGCAAAPKLRLCG